MQLLLSGDAPPLIPAEESSVILSKDERIILALPEITLSEMRAVQTGGSRGVSFRVMKGVYYHVGSFQSQSHEQLKAIDRGRFILTNKRLIFSGAAKSMDIDLRKISTVVPYSDAITVTKNTGTKPEVFRGLDKATLTVTIEGRTFVEKLTGLMVKYIIEGSVKKLE